VRQMVLGAVGIAVVAVLAVRIVRLSKESKRLVRMPPTRQQSLPVMAPANSAPISLEETKRSALSREPSGATDVARRRWAPTGLINVVTVIVCAYALLGALIWLGNDSFLRGGLAVFLALLGPGFSLIRLLVPRSARLDSVEQAALAAVISLAVWGLLAVALARSPRTLDAASIVIATFVFTVICWGAAWYRQRHIEEARASVRKRSRSLPRRWWEKQSGASRVVGLALVLALAGGVWMLGHVLAGDRGEPPMTEFSLDKPSLGLTGSAVAQSGRPFTVHWRIRNREGRIAVYRVRAFVGARELGQSPPLKLGNGEVRSGVMEVVIPPEEVSSARRPRLNLILEQDGQPHRHLQLWIEPPQKGELGNGRT
jgi:uncharacterized membrane protein